MDKNIVILILIILLLASILTTVYFYLTFDKIEKYSQERISNLENSGKLLQQKLDYISKYAKALDLILEPSRQQLGLDTKTQTTKNQWLSDLSGVTGQTNDSKLQDILKKITDGASEQVMVPTVQYMDYAVKAILASLAQK
jgi:hypothetical protein